MTSELHIENSTRDGVTIVRLVGSAGYPTADPLQTALTQLAAERPATVVFDATDLDFVCSMVLGVLVSFRRGMQRNNSRVILAALKPAVRSAFETSRLNALFEIVDQVNDAIAPKR